MLYILSTLSTIVLQWTWDSRLSLWDPDFNSFGYMPRSRLAGSYSNSIFHFLRKLHTVFSSGCIILHPNNSCTRIPFFISINRFPKSEKHTRYNKNADVNVLCPTTAQMKRALYIYDIWVNTVFFLLMKAYFSKTKAK